MADIKKVGILGGGMMGSDIALSCALAGYEVLIKELNMDLATAAHRRIVSSLEKWVSKGRLTVDDQGRKKVKEAITPTDSFDGF